jgi:transcriptional regulator with XRE-family HTH domain
MKSTRKNVEREIGAKVRGLREEFRIPRDLLAEDIGVSVAELADIEEGRRGVDVYQLCVLCALFVRPLLYFFDDWDEVKTT